MRITIAALSLALLTAPGLLANAQTRGLPSPPSPAINPQDHGAPNPSGRVNLNTASVQDLRSLPFVTAADADRIVRGRPYANSTQLTEKSIVPPSTFTAIKDLVTVSATPSR